jgi:hypothetical protein
MIQNSRIKLADRQKVPRRRRAPFSALDTFFAVRSWVIAPPVCPDLIYDRHSGNPLWIDCVEEGW